MDRKKRIAIFASGRGSNAKAIYAYSLNQNAHFEIDCILSNRKNSGILEFAKENNIFRKIISKNEIYNTDNILKLLRNRNIDLIVLAGFLLLIPEYLIEAFPKKIINIHPALLPKYGGKGMYGHYIHEAVKDNGDSKSGITIHFVDKKYDEGPMIFQAQCQILKNDSTHDIAENVLKLEHHFYPLVIDGVASRIKTD